MCTYEHIFLITKKKCFCPTVVKVICIKTFMLNLLQWNWSALFWNIYFIEFPYLYEVCFLWQHTTIHLHYLVDVRRVITHQHQSATSGTDSIRGSWEDKEWLTSLHSFLFFFKLQPLHSEHFQDNLQLFENVIPPVQNRREQNSTPGKCHQALGEPY